MFELEGVIKEVVRDTEDIKKIVDENKTNVGRKSKDKTSKSEKQSNKSGGNKKAKENKSKKMEQKYSDVLSEAEEASFAGFTKKKGEFCYDTINIQGNRIDMKPNSTAVVKIGFGLPNVLLEKKQEEIRKLSEKQKGKGKAGKEGKEKGNKKSGSTRSSKAKESKDGKLKPVEENQIYHVTKYNVMLNKTFLKDFILISTFIG